MSVTQAIQGKIDRAVGRVAQMVRRGIVKTVNAAGRGQVEGFTGEHFDGTEFWQQFGLASRPPAGTEAIVILVDADGDKPIAVATNSRADRPPALGVGDAALFGKMAGGSQALVWAKADGDVDITASSSGFVTLGANATPAEFAIKGVTFNAAHLTMLTALQAAMTTLGQSGAASAIGTFITAQPTFLTVKGKVF